MNTRSRSLLVAVAAAFPVGLGGGCATLANGGMSAAPGFQGKTVIEARTKEINAKATVAKDCPPKTGEADKGGVVEVTAAADGSLKARAVMWRGSPEVAQCIVDKANKEKVTPLPGPPIASLWSLTPDGTEAPAPVDRSKVPTGAMQVVRNKMQAEVQACAQRNLPPEFSADVEVVFYIFPGGKPAAANVTDSTAKDGAYESCVRDVILATQFPEMTYDGGFPMSLAFHVGNIEGGP